MACWLANGPLDVATRAHLRMRKEAIFASAMYLHVCDPRKVREICECLTGFASSSNPSSSVGCLRGNLSHTPPVVLQSFSFNAI